MMSRTHLSVSKLISYLNKQQFIKELFFLNKTRYPRFQKKH